LKPKESLAKIVADALLPRGSKQHAAELFFAALLGLRSRGTGKTYYHHAATNVTTFRRPVE